MQSISSDELFIFSFVFVFPYFFFLILFFIFFFSPEVPSIFASLFVSRAMFPRLDLWLWRAPWPSSNNDNLRVRLIVNLCWFYSTCWLRSGRPDVRNEANQQSLAAISISSSNGKSPHRHTHKVSLYLFRLLLLLLPLFFFFFLFSFFIGFHSEISRWPIDRQLKLITLCFEMGSRARNSGPIDCFVCGGGKLKSTVIWMTFASA